MIRCKHAVATLAFAAVFVALLPQRASAGGDDKEVTIGEVHKFRSQVLGEERALLVHLPAGYALTTDHYPVLYLLDGAENFVHTAGLAHFLGTRGIAPNLIVVGIVNVDRNRDFTPSRVADHKGWAMPSSGGAAKFTAFLEKEVIPLVDKKFRTHSYRILVGHSLGGLFSTHTLLTRPDLFNAHIAISPYLEWNNQEIFTGMAKALAKRSGPRFLFATYGGLEDKSYDNNLRALRKSLQKNAAKSLDWHVTRLEDDDHGSVVHTSLYQGLRALYRSWRPPAGVDLAGLEKHYRKLSKQHGYEIKVPENTINMLGYGELLKKKNPKKAIEIFTLNVKMHPRSANVYDSLGEAYEADGQLDKALANYEIAVAKLARKKKHDRGVMKVYKEHVARAKKQLAK